MIATQLIARGITNRRTLAAVDMVPREVFVEDTQKNQAYDDLPLPIGHDQTISQPYMVAAMTDLLRIDRSSKVLEIGTGSGYQTAVLAKIAKHVWSMERIAEHSDTAQKRLRSLGLDNITFIVGDGAEGFGEQSPYDGILVAAATPEVPPALAEQLAENGRLVIPLGNRSIQTLTVFTKIDGHLKPEKKMDCRFVPLISPHAFE